MQLLGTLTTPDGLFKPINVTYSHENEDGPIMRTPSPVKKLSVSSDESFMTVFYDTGMKKVREEKMILNGKIHGIYKRWHENGMICEETLYSQGIINGKQYYYSINGKLSHAFNYKEGVLHGKQFSYHSNSILASKSNYCNGTRIGENVSYYPSGALKSLETYNSEGLLTGTSRQYHMNGRLARDCTYVNGKLHGMYFEYNDHDLPIRALYFEHGIVKGTGV